jgi:hypothetical protein
MTITQRIKKELLTSKGKPKFTISKIKLLYVNQQLNAYMARIIDHAGNNAEKELLLIKLKLLLTQVARSPDENEYQSNKAEFNQFFDTIAPLQKEHDPNRWIDAQLTLLNYIKDQTAKLNQREWYLKAELMLIMDWSNSTFNRQVAEGLPARKAPKGADIIIFRQELMDWLNNWPNAYHIN